MALTKLSLILGITLLSQSPAMAFLDVCTLQQQPIAPTAQITLEKIDSYRLKLKEECALYQKSKEIKAYSAKENIPLEKIYLYQAIRYVDRFSYDNGKASDMPVELIFQVTEPAAQLPVQQRSDLVWRNWQRGMDQLPSVIADIENGKAFDISYLQKIHAGFFVENESATIDPSRAGVLKNGIYPAVNWPLKTLEEIRTSTAVAKIIDDNLYALGLRPHLVAEEDYANKLIDVRGSLLYPAAPKAIRAHLTNMLTLLNGLLSEARQNKPMIWKDRLFTPNELAYFIQQYIVQIHGFHDGNGRISRFWQDVILAVFDLPAGASGELNYNDMTAEPDEYYHRALAASLTDLKVIEYCFKYEYPAANTKPVSYDCRILK